MALFDAPDRETCSVRSERTNTPLQALTLLNETAFVEAARALAERVMRECGTDTGARLVRAFRIVTSRTPSNQEQQVLLQSLQQHLSHYRKHPNEAQKLLKVGDSRHVPGLDELELAAYSAVANTLLSLDEAITQH
jgi:hypothetical protein